MDDKPQSYKDIMQDPLAQLRQRVMTAFNIKATKDDDTQVIAEIRALVEKKYPAEQVERFNTQLPEQDEAFATVNLTTPELQLLKGLQSGILAIEYSSYPEGLDDNDSLRNLLGNDTLEEERRLLAQSAAAIPGLRARQDMLDVAWVMPAGEVTMTPAYKCDPDTGEISLDLPRALMTGLESARGILQREAAYGIGTLFFTPRMEQARARMAQIKAKEKRTPAEHESMIRLAGQWLARYDVTVAAESNYANRFAAERGLASAQDYASSLNYAEAVSGSIPEAVARLADYAATPGHPLLQFQNLQRAISYSFFSINGLFDNTEDGWRSMGVEPGMIHTSDGALHGMDALQELHANCQIMASLQPAPRDRMSGDLYYTRRMEEFSHIRGDFADQIFERYAAHFLPALEEHAVKNPAEAMKRLEDLSKKPGEEEVAPDKANVEGQGKMRDAKLPPKTPRPSKDEGDPSMEEMMGEGEGAPSDSDEDGDGPSMEEMMGKGKGEGDGDGEGADGDGDGKEIDPKEIEQLKKMLEENKGKGGKNAGDSFSDVDADTPEDDGDLGEYKKIIAPHRPVITQATGVMKKIQDKLTLRLQDPSRRNSLVPEDGDIARFQSDALKDRLIKQFSGQAIDETDFETFKVDGPIRKIPAKTEVHILIDGSGSMAGQPVEMAMTAGCILYEAAREAGIDVYITMMGEPEPIAIARPGPERRGNRPHHRERARRTGRQQGLPGPLSRRYREGHRGGQDVDVGAGRQYARLRRFGLHVHGRQGRDRPGQLHLRNQPARQHRLHRDQWTGRIGD